MRRFWNILAWLVTGLAACVIVLFAVANRSQVQLSLFPLPYEIAMPAFLLVLFVFMTGLATGGLVMWCKARKIRRLLGKEKRHANALAEQVAAMEAERASAATLSLSIPRLP